jgi:hypothetical protein
VIGIVVARSGLLAMSMTKILGVESPWCFFWINSRLDLAEWSYADHLGVRTTKKIVGQAERHP